MKINFVYDQSVETMADKVQFKAGMELAAAKVTSVIDDNITVNIEVGSGGISGGTGNMGNAAGLGGANYALSLSYAQTVAELRAHATTAAEKSAVNHMAATAPSINQLNMPVSSAQAKAWGLISATAPALDGALGIANLYGMQYNDTTGVAYNKLDFVGIAEHEITHVLGRSPGFGPLELATYSAPGVLWQPSNTPGYFSQNGGVTKIQTFDTVSDKADWTANKDPSDAFGAQSNWGITTGMTAADARLMGAMGYHLKGSPAATAAPLLIPANGPVAAHTATSADFVMQTLPMESAADDPKLPDAPTLKDLFADHGLEAHDFGHHEHAHGRADGAMGRFAEQPSGGLHFLGAQEHAALMLHAA